MLSIVSIISIFLFFIISCAKNKAPSSPTGINAEVRYTYIHVSWDAVPNADYYIINYKGLLEKAYGTSFDDYNPKNGYNEYRVAAVNDYGKSSYISTNCYYSGNGGGGGGGGGGSTTPPSAPTGVSATVIGSQVKISWNSVSNATSYEVLWSETGNSYTYSIGTTSNTYIYDTGPYENNYYKVKAKNSYGESSLSSSAYCHYSSGGGGGGGGTSAPSAPIGVSAYNAGSTAVPNVKISWNSVSGATSYKVYRSTSASSGYSQIGSSTFSTYLYDSNPKNGNNYYKVKAFNSAGGSSYSDYALFNYDANGYEPCPPHTLTGSATSTGSSSAKITLHWAFSTTGGCGRPTKIHVRVMDPDSNSGIEVDNSPFSGSATSCTFTIGYLPAWNMGSGWILMGVAGENDHGTSSYKTISYNYLTNEWR